MRNRIKIIIITLLVIVAGAGIYFYLPPILSDNIYPLEYKDMIIKYSKQFSLDPNFVSAVIFSESRFNSQATSPVGARGLMQIMPRTGLGISKYFNEDKNYSADKLYNPETNIKYGCWYLRNLLSKYKGHWENQGDVTLTLIAYNGGVALADRYAVSQGSLNMETSYYVVKVQQNKKIYDQLYGNWGEKVEKKEKPKRPTLRDVILSWLLGRG